MDRVRAALVNTKCIAWDGSHQIWLALDEKQAMWFRESADPAEYKHVYSGTGMLEIIQSWWHQSDNRRFIHGIRSPAPYVEDQYVRRVVQLVRRSYNDPHLKCDHLCPYNCNGGRAKPTCHCSNGPTR